VVVQAGRAPARALMRDAPIREKASKQNASEYFFRASMLAGGAKACTPHHDAATVDFQTSSHAFSGMATAVSHLVFDLQRGFSEGPPQSRRRRA